MPAAVYLSSLIPNTDAREHDPWPLHPNPKIWRLQSSELEKARVQTAISQHMAKSGSGMHHISVLLAPDTGPPVHQRMTVKSPKISGSAGHAAEASKQCADLDPS